MNDNGVFVVGEHGSYRMLLSQKWYLEAKKRGLRDPWQHRPDKSTSKKVIKEFMGKEMEVIEVTTPDVDEETLSNWKLERDEYMRQRDEWTCLQMFHKYGYEIFLGECAMRSLTVSKDFKKSVFPCESQGDPQCSLFCPIWHTCAIRMNGG